MQPDRETKHLNCHCGSAIVQTVEAFGKYSAFHSFPPSLSLSPFHPLHWQGIGSSNISYILFLPPEMLVVHINSRRTHNITLLYWYTGGSCSLPTQYFFLRLYLSILSMRNICTLHCWRVEMKCWTQVWNTKWDMICSQRFVYWHQVNWYGLHHLRYVINGINTRIWHWRWLFFLN